LLNKVRRERSKESRRERLGEGICALRGGSDVLEFHQLGAYKFTEIVISDVNVTGALVVNGVFALGNTRGIVFVKECGVSW